MISESAYYAQPRRKTAIIYGKYRYIFNKETNTEELYDVSWDSNQNFNLISDWYKDLDRKKTSLSRELFFYPDWDELPKIREKMRKIRKSFWKEPSKKELFGLKLGTAKRKIKSFLFKL